MKYFLFLFPENQIITIEDKTKNKVKQRKPPGTGCYKCWPQPKIHNKLLKKRIMKCIF